MLCEKLGLQPHIHIELHWYAENFSKEHQSNMESSTADDMMMQWADGATRSEHTRR